MNCDVCGRNVPLNRKREVGLHAPPSGPFPCEGSNKQPPEAEEVLFD